MSESLRFRGLLARLGTALALIPIVLALIWIPFLQPLWVLFVCAFVLVGAHEYFGLLQVKGIQCETFPGMVVATAVAASMAWIDAVWIAPVGIGAAMLMCLIRVLRGRVSIAGLGGSVFGVLYTGWFGGHILLLHRLPNDGPGLVLLLLVAVILTDAGAYFSGKYLGRRKMAPIISPNKTWEGASGGFIMALAGAAILYAMHAGLDWPPLPPWPLWIYVATGAALSAAAQLGDLIESALKRDAGVKDAGTVFPGHGGALDRCDGYLFAAPMLYYIALFISVF